MNSSYWTKEFLRLNPSFDFDSILIDQQELLNQKGYAFMFSDVVLTLKTISKDFTEPDRKFHDADNIIRRIITKYVEQNPNAKLNMPVDESAAKSSAAPEAEESVEEKIARIRRIVKRLGVEMMAASAQEKAKLAQKIKLYDVKIKSLTKV